MKNLDEINNRVKEYLRVHPTTRESYIEMICRIWYSDLIKMYGVEYASVFKPLFVMMRDDKLSNLNSILRSWRKLQQMNPELRGKTYTDRHTRKVDEAKEQLRNKKNWKNKEELPF